MGRLVNSGGDYAGDYGREVLEELEQQKKIQEALGEERSASYRADRDAYMNRIREIQLLENLRRNR